MKEARRKKGGIGAAFTGVTGLSGKPAACHQANDQHDHRYDQEQEEQEFGYSGSCRSDSAKTENSGDDRDDEKYCSPFQHFHSPPLLPLPSFFENNVTRKV
jgi:hypothetical protein